MSDIFMGVIMVVVFILVNATMFFMPESWNNILLEFSIKHWYVAPIFMVLAIFGVPLFLVWKTSQDTGVPFRIVFQSLWEYLTAKNYAEKRLSTLKLVKTEKELEENK